MHLHTQEEVLQASGDDDDDDECQDGMDNSEASPSSEPSAPAQATAEPAPTALSASPAPTVNDDEASVAGCETPPVKDDVMGTTGPPVEQHPGGSLVLISDDECGAACDVKDAICDHAQPIDPSWPHWFDPMVEDSQPDPGPDWKSSPPKVPEEPAARVGLTPCELQFHN